MFDNWIRVSAFQKLISSAAKLKSKEIVVDINYYSFPQSELMLIQ